jgi:beta-glucosidase
MIPLGFNCYRFSIEWSRIQPENKDEFDENEMNHYIDLINELLKHSNIFLNNKDIKPIITLHHFTNPIWFDSIGGFEKEENLIFFENYCEYVFKNTNLFCSTFITLNEFEIYALMGYVDKTDRSCLTIFNFNQKDPPGKKSLSSAFQCLKNMCIVHTNIYQKFKSINPTCEIGITKNYSKIRSFTSWNPFELVPVFFINYFRDTCVLNYFKFGLFSIPIPFIGKQFNFLISQELIIKIQQMYRVSILLD